jgi:hypothetical protein
MPRTWSSFASVGASTSAGSRRTRVVEADATEHIMPPSFRIGDGSLNAFLLYIRGLLGDRKNYVSQLLRNAQRRYPLPGPSVLDSFMSDDYPQQVTLIRLWKPNTELMDLLLYALTVINPPTPRFYLALDDLPRMVSYSEWSCVHGDRTINGVPIGCYNEWISFMGSAVMLTGDEHIDAYYLRVRREMQSFPASNNILDILDGPSQSLPMDRASE